MPEVKKQKVLVVRQIWLKEGVPTKPGKVIELTAAEIKHYGNAVTKDFDDGDDE